MAYAFPARSGKDRQQKEKLRKRNCRNEMDSVCSALIALASLGLLGVVQRILQYKGMKDVCILMNSQSIR